MGCDIHTFVEQRNGHDNWLVVEPPEAPRWSQYEWPDDRDYTAFVALAGVRCVRYYGGRPAHDLVDRGEPNGLPDDLSSEVLFEMEELHSLCHMSVDEYERRCRQAVEANAQAYGQPQWTWEGTTWERNVRAMRALGGEVRVVMGFDS